MSRARTIVIHASLALSLAMVGLTGCTALSGTGLPLAPKDRDQSANLVTVAPIIKSAVKDLQQISALNQLATLTGAGGVSAQAGAQGSGAAFRISATATSSMTPQQLADFNAHATWDNGGSTWAFVATDGWFEMGSPAGTYVGTETVTDAGGAVLESNPMRMDYVRNGQSAGPNDWSGTDTIQETVSQSKLRPDGSYRHVRETIRSSNLSNDIFDVATESIDFTPMDGGAQAHTLMIRNEVKGADGSHQGTKTYSGSLPDGTSFLTSIAENTSVSVMDYRVDGHVAIDQDRKVTTQLRLIGTPAPDGHGPASIDASSTLEVALRKADDSVIVALSIKSFTVDSVAKTIETDGIIVDGSGAQAATFKGTFDIGKDQWSGIATYADGTQDPINLDAVARLISN
ncbi:MAG TPA: hypothetical protein V6D05_07755 [Stenomitos sp.]